MAVLVFSLALVPAAFADESSISGYNPDDSVGQELGVTEDSPGAGGGETDGEQVAGLPVEGGGDSGAGGSSAGVAGLPFTGLDLGLILGAGGMLALLGLGLRRLTSAPSRAV